MYPPCTVRAGALHNACLVAATEVVEANRTHSGVLEQERETVTLTVTPEREGLRVYTRGGEWIRCSNASCRGPCCRPANAVSQIALHFIYTYRGSNLGYAETHPPSGSQLDTKRLTRVLDTGPRHGSPTAAPPTRTAHAPRPRIHTRTGSARHPASMADGCGLALARAFSRVPSSKCTPRRPSKSLRGACHLRLFLASPSSCHLDRDQRDARSCFASAAAPLSSTLRTGSSSACMAHRLAALLSRSCCWHLAIMRRLRT